jgi:mRNA deadenylase 3'-5' endonuclease subunit Ccr4
MDNYKVTPFHLFPIIKLCCEFPPRSLNHGMTMVHLKSVVFLIILSSSFILYCTSMKLNMNIPRLLVSTTRGPTRGQNELARLRVLQYNILADGLSGMREDKGGFSRAKREHLDWKRRKGMILQEILRYEPDVITLQECDHFHDFFLPELSAAGYTGVFAPKPISACLEVSNSSDGCAIFVKDNKLRIDSTEVSTETFRHLTLSSP